MKRSLRILRSVGAGLVIVIALGAAVVYFASERRLDRAYQPPPAALDLASADTARGRHLAAAVSVCIECHGADLGGTAGEPNPVLRINPPNLTRGRGGVGAARSDADLARAIRYGVRPDGTPLILMPADAYAALSDSDLAAVVAYIRAAPPVDRDVGASSVGPIGRVLLVAGKLDEIPAERLARGEHPGGAWGTGVRPAATPPPSDTVAHGRYLAQIAGCAACHTASFGGRAGAFGPPGVPPPTNITRSGIGHYTEADFARAMREGRRPDGRPISEFMPWKYFARMTDDEVHALWAYLQSVPPAGAANASRAAAN